MARAWAGFRIGSVVVLLAAVAASPPRGARTVPELVLTLVLVADCAVVAGVFLRLGRIAPAWAVLDVVGVVVMVGLSTWPGVMPGPPGQGYLYGFTVVAAPTVGMPAWPPWVTLAGGAGVAFMDFSPALRSGSSYPRWNALPDAVAIVGVALLAALLVRLQRGSAAALDRHRRAAVERASLLARQRERLRQQADLSTHLMATVDALVAGEGIGDPTISGRLREEAAALRRAVAVERWEGGVVGVGGLVEDLRALADDKAAIGLRVGFEAEGDAATETVMAAAAAAMVAAAGEALTNVRKHAGTDRAELRLAVMDAGVSITVADQGQGYDAAATAEGFGQTRSLRQRMADVGGRVDIESAPGAGTQVVLWVPFAGEPGEEQR
ncbi:sensor histidine kinase [Catenulispora yoronensis]|uniref:sensor histidine kinase n=1 Tax=Catenulispora yoronensis TaxID=450799 RepID=UPI0031E1BD95